MSRALTFGIGTTTNINLVGIAALSFVDNQFNLLNFCKATSLKSLLEDFIIPFAWQDYDKVTIYFKSKKIARFFRTTHTIPEGIVVRSLDIDNSFVFDEKIQYSVLSESLASGYVNLEQLSKTNREILQRALNDISDVLTQSVLVATAKPPRIYNFEGDTVKAVNSYRIVSSSEPS